MMVFIHNSCQQLEGNTIPLGSLWDPSVICGHPGGQIPDFLYQKLPQTLLLLSYVYFCGQCALSDGPNRKVFWHNLGLFVV